MQALILSFLQKKAVMYGLALLAFAGLVIYLYRKFSGEGKDDFLSSVNSQKRKDRKDLSFTDQEYLAFAEIIEQNTHHYFLDDDHDKVFAVFAQMQSLADLNALIAAYGVRDNGNVFGWETGEDLNLVETISSEFSQSQLTRLNQQLADQGILYTFI